MQKTKSIYQTLNKREKYILETLKIQERDLVPDRYFEVMDIMKDMTEGISELPLTREQVVSAVLNYGEPQEELFKGVEIIPTENDYPNIKVNMYNVISEENRKVLEILGVKIEDKEITCKEYSNIGYVVVNKVLAIYGTGIKRKECYKLQKKIGKKLLEQLRAESF